MFQITQHRTPDVEHLTLDDEGLLEEGMCDATMVEFEKKRVSWNANENYSYKPDPPKAPPTKAQTRKTIAKKNFNCIIQVDSSKFQLYYLVFNKKSFQV